MMGASNPTFLIFNLFLTSIIEEINKENECGEICIKHKFNSDLTENQTPVLKLKILYPNR